MAKVPYYSHFSHGSDFQLASRAIMDLTNSPSTNTLDKEWLGSVVSIRPQQEEREYSLYIPPEIWYKIFDWAHRMTVHPLPGILSVDHCGGNPRPQRSFGLIVSHVSQRWRDISTNLPSLWSWINYGTLSRYGSELRNYNIVELFIRRSQNYPLDVRLTSHSFGDDLTLYSDEAEGASGSCLPNKDSRAMDIIFNHAYRWRSAHIILLPHLHRDDDVPFRLLFLSAPSLQRLWFYSPSSFPLQNGFLLGNAPSLKSVRWDGVNPLFLTLLTLSNVQCLDLTGQGGSITSLSILQKMPSLVMLAVCLDTFDSSCTKVEMPYLQTLQLAPTYRMGASFVKNLLYSISAPVLNRLILFRLSGMDMREFVSLLQQDRGAAIFPVLKTLDIIAPPDQMKQDGMSHVSEDLMSGLETICHLVLVSTPVYDVVQTLSTAKLWPFLAMIQFGRTSLPGG
jgi:hypothetical protein